MPQSAPPSPARGVSALQKVEVAPFRRLRHAFPVEADIATLGQRRRRERGEAARDLLRLDQQVQPLVPYRQADTVTVLHRGERSADGGFGAICSTIVPKAVPDIRASEMRTMSFTPARASFFGIGR